MTAGAKIPAHAPARILFLGAGLLFLVNIGIGIANVFGPEHIHHAQLLTHFHAATIGWITLSALACALWFFSDQPNITPRYVRTASILAWIGVVAVTGYVAAFALAFGIGEPYWALLPTFSIPTWAVIIGVLILTASAMRKQRVLTTAHILSFGALLVVALGATMGVIWGLTYSTNIDPYPNNDNVDSIGAHAGPMEMYLALAFGAFVEVMRRRDPKARWRWPGLTQGLLGIVAAFTVAIALFVGIAPLVPISLLLFLIAFGFYMVRVGWRTFTVNPAHDGRSPAIFWGGLYFPLYIGLFVTLVMVYFIPEKEIPRALGVTFAHVVFVGMATNLTLAIHSTFADQAGAPANHWEPIGVWIMNLGLWLFIAGEFLGGRREGSLVMAVGVLMALGTVAMRVWMTGKPTTMAREG